ncbi:NADH-quinone oxidoreductase subunit J|uniref:NADH-quinone oxidoreductase subunit J n=1 Tax=Dendrosporobacter quercicolus TaxID=146817 RepID=A0A1G9QDD8_9FIRM|nr:NADH-quinone oxidoreductase subunit J [Dendrosporobacter quercicolus]NSL48196.1 NADH-quinone oxidoreductase subunit J [Dendrosporobacter quercicolus DSM 1736]SDM08751.1 NADH dehydrogenase subunit J [Dendrosporobacter quercicolus]
MSELVFIAAFYLLAAVTVASALGVVLKQNLVHSALLLVVCFIGVSGLYVMLNAEFLAAVQLLVYSGAIAVILVLGVMLTRRRSMNESNQNNERSFRAAALGTALLAVLVGAIALTPWQHSAAGALDHAAPVIARALLTDYMVAFEVAALLLLAAMVGAIVLAKGVEEE